MIGQDRQTIQITVKKRLDKTVKQGKNQGAPFVIIDYGAEKGLYVWPSDKQAYELAKNAKPGDSFNAEVEGLGGEYPKVVKIIQGNTTGAKNAVQPSAYHNQGAPEYSTLNPNAVMLSDALKAYDLAMIQINREWAYDEPNAHTSEEFRKKVMERAKEILEEAKVLTK